MGKDFWPCFVYDGSNETTKLQPRLRRAQVAALAQGDATKGLGVVHGSLNSPFCSCVSITLPASSKTRITESCERL
jgi:hypothetical protein